MSKSPEGRKKNAERQQKSEVARVRSLVTNYKNGCPDMSRADGKILLDEIDRLNTKIKAMKDSWKVEL